MLKALFTLTHVVASSGWAALHLATEASIGVGKAVSAPALGAGRELATLLEINAAAATKPRAPWVGAQRIHIDIPDPLTDGAGPAPLANTVQSAAAAVRDVRRAHVEPALNRLIIELHPDANPRTARLDILEVLEEVCAEASHTRPPSSPVFPSGPLSTTAEGKGSTSSVLTSTGCGAEGPLAIAALAATADLLAATSAVMGRWVPLPHAPRAVRAAVAMVRHQPRLVASLHDRLGPAATDLVITLASAAAHGMSQAPAVPLLDLTHRLGQLAELWAYRQAWSRWEPLLTAPHRPRPVLAPSLGAPLHQDSGLSASKLDPTAHPGSRTVPLLQTTDTVNMGVPSGGGDLAYGEVEDYCQQAAGGSLLAAAGALVAGGDAENIAGAVLAGVPHAAHLGHEAFAHVLGRGLASRGLFIADPDALRRLEQVRVVLIDGAALRGDNRMVLDARGQAPGWDTDRVYAVGDALLHGEIPPEPDAHEAPAAGATLRWRDRPHPTSEAADGRQLAELVVDERVVGELEAGWEPDHYALALLETARRAGAHVVLRHVAGTEDLATAVAETHAPGTRLSQLLPRLRARHGPVMLISSLHANGASTDTLAALRAADVAVAVDDPHAAAAWGADIMTTAELAQAVRVVSAVPAAQASARTAVGLAKAGSTLEGLTLTTGDPQAGAGVLGLGRWIRPLNWFSPVQVTAAIALAVGAAHARSVLRRPDPVPVPLTAWHALDLEIVFARLTGGPTSLADAPAALHWGQRWNELARHDALMPLQRGVGHLARLLAATRAELADPLTPVLAVGAAASAILGGGTDAILVVSVMATNALVSGFQRMRADSAVAALFAENDQLARRVAVPVLGTTRRRLRAAQSGKHSRTIPAARLCVGDVIALRATDVVPADARLLAATDLEVDESTLSGESLPVAKCTEPTLDAELGRRASMVFAGTTVVAGDARAIVVATDSATAARRALNGVADLDTAVGIAARLAELTKKVLPATLAGGAAVTGLSLLNGQSLRRAVADGVAIAVAAVPEGLPLVTTVAQLAAARRLAERGVLVRVPRAIEGLGRVDTICFDKTGTLTQNRLRVVTAIPADWNLDDRAPEITDVDAHTVVTLAARTCPPAHTSHGHAHATDEAILRAVPPSSSDVSHPNRLAWVRLHEIPFDSSRGYSAAIGHHPLSIGGDPLASGHSRSSADQEQPSVELVVKGAPEIMLDRCQLLGNARERADKTVLHLAGQGLRVLAVAQRTLRVAELPRVSVSSSQDGGQTSEPTAQDLDSVVDQLNLVGFVGIADTVRPTAPTLINQLAAVDRQVVLITGDHPVTARAIASQLGVPSDCAVVTGADLERCDEAGRAELAADARIFARVSPEQKVQVITALQRAGKVCAMVGDGANDAAAIRAATVGIGVTNRGSSAARGAADLILTEDDLTVVIDALVEGRQMWDCVRQAVIILLGGNAGEVAFTIAGTALGHQAPLNTRQLLLVNLLTDMFPALAVAVTPQRLSRPGSATTGYREIHRADSTGVDLADWRTVLAAPTPTLDRPLIDAILKRGAATTLGATLAWALGNLTPGTRGRSATMGLTALVGTQLAQTLRTRQHSPLVVATSLGSVAALIGIVQTPGVSRFFGCTPLGPLAWSGVLASTALATIASAAATPTSLVAAPPDDGAESIADAGRSSSTI